MTRNVNFTQTISVKTDHPEKLIELAAEWDRNQAEADVMGYMGSFVLADREHPGEYMLMAEFGVVDPDVPAYEEAMKNNDRPETQEWDRRL